MRIHQIKTFTQKSMHYTNSQPLERFVSIFDQRYCPTDLIKIQILCETRISSSERDEQVHFWLIGKGLNCQKVTVIIQGKLKISICYTIRAFGMNLLLYWVKSYQFRVACFSGSARLAQRLVRLDFFNIIPSLFSASYSFFSV